MTTEEAVTTLAELTHKQSQSIGSLIDAVEQQQQQIVKLTGIVLNLRLRIDQMNGGGDDEQRT